MGPLHFYNRNDPYYEFTNFYFGKPVTIDGLEWKTTEHYFQAQKFVGTPYVELIRNMSRPREAFDFSRNPSVSEWRRRDWQQVKQTVMYKALLAKFSQSKQLGEMLASTGDRELVEHSPYDRYWGDGGDGSGKNHLGRLLMKVRSVGDAPPCSGQDEAESGGGNTTGACVATSTDSVTSDVNPDPQQPSPSQAPEHDSNLDPRQSSPSKAPGGDSNPEPHQSSPSKAPAIETSAIGANKNAGSITTSTDSTSSSTCEAPTHDSATLNPELHQSSPSEAPGHDSIGNIQDRVKEMTEESGTI